MVHLLEFSPAWREVSELLEERNSSVMIAPRNYGKWALLQKYAKKCSAGSALRCVTVSSRVPTLEGDLDYSWLWESVRSQLGSDRGLELASRTDFLSAVESVMDGTDTHVIFFVGGAGRGHEENHYRVLSLFQRLIVSGKITVVAVDDYSSFYYQKQNFLLSDLHSLLQVQIGPISSNEIAAYIAKVSGAEQLPKGYVETAANQVYARSGGHVGIAQEILRGLQRTSWPALGEAWESCVDGLLKRSVVLESIARALEEDAEGCARTAIEYRAPAVPEQNSPRIYVLRQLGVLHREHPP